MKWDPFKHQSSTMKPDNVVLALFALWSTNWSAAQLTDLEVSHFGMVNKYNKKRWWAKWSECQTHKSGHKPVLETILLHRFQVNYCYPNVHPVEWCVCVQTSPKGTVWVSRISFGNTRFCKAQLIHFPLSYNALDAPILLREEMIKMNETLFWQHQAADLLWPTVTNRRSAHVVCCNDAGQQTNSMAGGQEDMVIGRTQCVPLRWGVAAHF